MKNLFWLLIAVICCSGLHAQNADSIPRHIVITTGMGYQVLLNSTPIFLVAAEAPIRHHWHIGVLANYYYVNSSAEYTNYAQGNGLVVGKEYGVYAKYRVLKFRRSFFYVGPEIRFGHRKYRQPIIYDDFSLNAFNLSPLIKTTKFLLQTGIQWQFKHAILEFSSSMGWDRHIAPAGVTLLNNKRLMFQPNLRIGIAL